jgi:hypothetical protein
MNPAWAFCEMMYSEFNGTEMVSRVHCILHECRLSCVLICCDVNGEAPALVITPA